MSTKGPTDEHEVDEIDQNEVTGHQFKFSVNEADTGDDTDGGEVKGHSASGRFN